MTSLNTEIATEIAGLLKLLANPNRLRILARLLDGEASVGSIETELDIRQPNLSRELSKLREAGAISARRQSKVVFYSLANEDVTSMLRRVIGQTAPIALTVSGPRPDFDPRPKFRFYPRESVLHRVEN